MFNDEWEGMVTDVCVAGRPEAVKSLAAHWDVIFHNAGTVAESLRDGIKDLKGKWKGQAAEDYFGKLEKIAKTLEDTYENNKGVVPMLTDCAEALGDAQKNMPVPDNLLDEVQGRADDLNRVNGYYGEALAIEGSVGTFGVSYLAYKLMPGSFREGVIDKYAGGFAREALGQLSSMVDDWINDYTGQAKAYWENVDNTYTQADAVAPTPTPGHTGVGTGDGGFPKVTGPGGGGTGKVPGLGGDTFKPTGFDSSGATSGVGYDPGAGTGVNSGIGGYDPNADPLGSLAGAGGGLDGLGAGGGGLNGLGGGPTGLGGGGLGAGGLGAGAGTSGIGKPVGPPGMPMGMGGAGAGGRGAAGKGRGVLGGGGGHGAGGHAPDDERGTWLTEDDDPWGGDTDAPPSVLG
jgi:uncharacterized protein YukE